MQKWKRTALVCGVSAAVALLGLTGCKSPSSDRSAGRMADDKQITEQVQSELNNEPVYKFSDVDVKTFGGVVQLSGFVTTDGQKQRAQEVAQSVSGVNRIINSIALKPQVPSPTGRGNSANPIYWSGQSNTNQLQNNQPPVNNQAPVQNQ